jgi:hypothetical protein
LLRGSSVKGSVTIMDDKRDFKLMTCISEEPKCNNSEINHADPKIETCMIIITIIIIIDR